MFNPFIIGLDIGQVSDPTALAVLDRTPVVDDAGRPVRDGHGHPLSSYACLHLDRYPLGSAYPDLVEKVGALVRSPAIQARGRPRLAIDATGVGRAVVDQFLGARMPAEVVPITITAGAGVTKDMWNATNVTCYRVAKADLVAAVRVGLDAGRMKFAPALALARSLRVELQNYQIKITQAAHETWNAREGAYDDLVLAVALAAWLGENATPDPGPSASAPRVAPVMGRAPDPATRWAAMRRLGGIRR